jgi:hypothetical protein
MKMYVYELGIIDDFTYFTPFNLKTFAHPDFSSLTRDYETVYKEVVYHLAKYTSWEGDGEFVFIPLLDIEEMYHPGYGVIIKQGNNGSTFMVSNIQAYGFESLRVDNIRKK